MRELLFKVYFEYMKIVSISKNFFVLSLAAALFILCAYVPLPANAATCTFTRDLELGVEGEDVRCLQQYLNGAGYTIATEGVGSKGRETTQFKSLTQLALIKWQKANNLSPAIGYFGANSRSVYKKLTSGGTTTPATSDYSAQLEAQLAALRESIKAATPSSAPTPASDDNDEDEGEEGGDGNK